MKLIKRIKNLWELSNYHAVNSPQDRSSKVLKKEDSTVVHKQAKIIPMETVDILTGKVIKAEDENI